MNKAKLLFALISLFSVAAPVRAMAGSCALPHDRLLARCGGEYRDVLSEEIQPSNETLSAVGKPDQSLKQLVADYRARADKSTRAVVEAREEHQAYLNKK